MAAVRVRILTSLAAWVVAAATGLILIAASPGMGVDERELDPRFGATEVAQIQREAEGGGFWSRLGSLASAIARGDLGHSKTLNKPVAGLLSERIPVTARSVAWALCAAWAAGFGLALFGSGFRTPLVSPAAAVSSASLMSLPSAVVALSLAWIGAGAHWAIAAALAPKTYEYSRRLIEEAVTSSHVLAAMARGEAKARVVVVHALPAAAPALVSLLGVTVTAGLAASIPAEVFCSSPGLGQLVWTAATGRDMAVLAASTILLSALTMAANLFCEAVSSSLPGVRA